MAQAGWRLIAALLRAALTPATHANGHPLPLRLQPRTASAASNLGLTSNISLADRGGYLHHRGNKNDKEQAMTYFMPEVDRLFSQLPRGRGVLQRNPVT